MMVLIGVAILVVAIAAMVFLKMRTIPIIAILIALGLLVVSLFVTQVPTGFTGVLTTFGKVEEDVTLEAGINFKMPWQKIVTMDNREQRSNFQFNAFSSDIQQTDVVGSVNYKINPNTAMTLFKSVGINYKDTLIVPRLFENVKIVFGRYTAENLIAKRDILADEILTLMKADLDTYGISIISIAIEDIDFRPVVLKPLLFEESKKVEHFIINTRKK